MKEECKLIQGFNNKYLISNTGIIKSINYKRSGVDKVMKKQKTKKNYEKICLYINKIPKYYFVHRLVASTFIPNLENKPYINHIDCNTLNNNVSNLEWCTQSENIQHAVNLGRHKSNFPKIRKTGKDNPQSKEVYQFNKDNNFINKFYSVAEASKITNIQRVNILKVCNYQRKYAGGFIWSYNKQLI